MTWRKLYDSLTLQLHTLPKECPTSMLTTSLQAWLRDNLARIPAPIRDRFHLAWYSSIRLSDYPGRHSSLDAVEETHRLLDVAPGSVETLVMLVRDILWAGITVDSEVQCPRCQGAGLRYLRDEAGGQIVLACDLCSWCQTLNGEACKGSGRLVAPSLAELRGIVRL